MGTVTETVSPEQQVWLEAQLPRKLSFLLNKPWHPIVVTPHGRGAATSWTYATVALILGMENPLRIVCCRETLQSISHSVHELLKNRVEALGIGAYYTCYDKHIIGSNGTKFTFHGLRTNAEEIKSLEGADITWVEEAEKVSKSSWATLVPTIFRKDTSRLRANYNPKLVTDETNRRFVLLPSPGTKVMHLTWRDHPWFPERLKIEMAHDFQVDPITARNIWDGEYLSEIQGAIFAEQMKAATAEGRIGNVPHDRTHPVDTFWDLGFGDPTAIWFAQAVDGWYRFIDYHEDYGKTIADYCIVLQDRAARFGYVYGNDWLPHDGVDAMIHKNMQGGDRSRSVEMLMRAAGRTPRIAPKMSVTETINAARTIFPNCYFDMEKCADGIQTLRHYAWKPDAHADDHRDPRQGFAHQTPVQKEPLHNWASHGASGFRTAAVCIRQPRKAPPKPQEEYRPVSQWS